MNLKIQICLRVSVCIKNLIYVDQNLESYLDLPILLNTWNIWRALLAYDLEKPKAKSYR